MRIFYLILNIAVFTSLTFGIFSAPHIVIKIIIIGFLLGTFYSRIDENIDQNKEILKIIKKDKENESNN